MWKYPLQLYFMWLILLNFSSLYHFTRSIKGPPLILPSYHFSSPSLSLLPYPSSLISFLPLLHPFSPTLIPPTFPPSVTQRHLSTAGLHSTLFFVGSFHLNCCPTFPPPHAVWLLLCPILLSVVADLMAIRPRVKCLTSSHAQRLLKHYAMSSLSSDMSIHFVSILGPGLHEALRILLKVVAGIGEGRLQGLPW